MADIRLRLNYRQKALTKENIIVSLNLSKLAKTVIFRHKMAKNWVQIVIFGWFWGFHRHAARLLRYEGHGRPR